MNLVPTSLEESQNFERGQIPNKSLRVGKYRSSMREFSDDGER
jgi:hypothetical protein